MTCALLSGAALQRLHNDGVGELVADAKSRVADLTNVIRVATDELDFLLLAEAHLPKAIAYIGRSGQTLDTHSLTGCHLTERTLGCVGAAAFKKFYVLLRHLLVRN